METVKLWTDIFDIINNWLLEHPELDVEELTDDIFDYVMEQYAPPF
jgi:hypothetical protein